MGALERAVEWLRPLVKIKEWGYCVVWNLGDDPSRFIGLMDCCCGGGHIIVKDESSAEEEQHLVPLRRDTHFQHPPRIKACEILAQYPPSLPLYSRIHEEVAISNQKRWLTHHATTSNPNYMDRASILGDAIDYIEELQKKVNNFQTVLREMEEVDCSKNYAVKRPHDGSTNADQRQQM